LAFSLLFLNNTYTSMALDKIGNASASYLESRDFNTQRFLLLDVNERINQSLTIQKPLLLDTNKGLINSKLLKLLYNS
jgi:hypothetical protein